jgi:stage II sporulation protein M
MNTKPNENNDLQQSNSGDQRLQDPEFLEMTKFEEQEDNFFTGSRPPLKDGSFAGNRLRKSSFFAYFQFIRTYVLAAAMVFFAAALAGYVFSANSPELGKMIMDRLNTQFGPLIQLNPLLIMLVIFLNNAFLSLLSLVLGLAFGIIPIVFVAVNGFVLGALANFVAEEKGLLFVLLSLLPHGIVELSMVFLAVGIGLRLGHQAFSALLGKPTEIKREFKEGIRFYFRWILPFLFIAAGIEIFITPLITMLA